MTVILVLLLLAVTLGLSYALVRTQSTNIAIRENADRRSLARQAALTGLTMGMKRMQTNDWEGVDTVYSRPLDDATGFHVAYSTGDAALSADDADYADYPYRVTLVSTGYAADPIDPARVAQHRAEAVVRLVPRALTSEPTGWSDVTGHTVCQYAAGDCVLNVPMRIEGPSRWRGTLELGLGLPWTSDARWWYFLGLRNMYEAGVADWRTFTSTVRFYSYSQYSDTWGVVESALGITPEQASYCTTLSLSTPSGDGYRLYTGGKLYAPTTVGSTLADTSLEPDPLTNPLGIFLRSGGVELQKNVTIHGSLVALGGTDADVTVTGAGVRIVAVALPALDGTTLPIRLPTILSADDILVSSGAGLTIEGMVIATDNFEVCAAPQDATTLALAGHLTAKDIYVRPRSDWVKTALGWTAAYNAFWNQYAATGGTPYFPVFLAKSYGLNGAPKIVFSKDASDVSYHWHASDAGIFVAHADDGGLRWELVRWRDNPD